ADWGARVPEIPARQFIFHFLFRASNLKGSYLKITGCGSSGMLVYFVTDEPTKLPAIRAMLEPQHAVLPWVLDGDGTRIRSHGVLMVDIDLRQMPRVDQLRFILQDLATIPEKLFVVHNLSRSMVAQAHALGATSVISRPKEAVLKVAEIEAAEAAAADSAAAPALDLDEGVAVFASMFSNVRLGKPVKVADAKRATSKILH